MRASLIDWDAASVEDATLTVALRPPPTRAWTRRLRGVLALLDRNHADWGEIRLQHAAIAVADVREGTEERLRHLLDSAVVEVGGRRADPDDEPAARDRAEQRARDRRMTEAFRASAKAAPGA